MSAPMTSIKDALGPVLSFLDELAANGEPGKRQALNPILIGGSAKLYAEGLRATLTTPAPGRDEMRERIEEILQATKRNPLMVGFVYSRPTVKELQERLDLVAELTRTILSALPVAPVWQTIDQAPKDGRYLIVAWFKQDELKWAKQSRWLTAQDAAELNGGLVEDFEGGWTDGDDEYDYCSPTHFMPLPAPGDKTMPVAPVVDGWCNADDIPPVPKGQMREYVVAVKRAKTGKAYEFAACYLNGYPIEYRDCCPKGDGCDGDGCDDGCPTTGWFEQTGDDYYDTMFNQMSIGKDDTFLGWRELPRWEDRATAPVVDEAAIRADEREKCALIVERWSLPTIQTPSMWLVDKQGIAQAIRAGGGER